MGGLPQLGPGEVPQGVGREIAEAPQRSVDVLQATFGIVRHLQAEEFLEQIVPGRREVFHLEISRYQSDFQLEAQQDVEVIGHFLLLLS